jgi:ankyrin repeat protein
VKTAVADEPAILAEIRKDLPAGWQCSSLREPKGDSNQNEPVLGTEVIERFRNGGFPGFFAKRAVTFRKDNLGGVLFKIQKGYLGGGTLEASDRGVGIALFESHAAALAAVEARRRNVAAVITKGPRKRDEIADWWFSDRQPQALLSIVHKNVVVEVADRRKPYSEVEQELWTTAKEIIAVAERGKQPEGSAAAAAVGFPVSPPIRDADPQVREKRIVRVPTRLIVVVAPDRITLSIDHNSWAEVELSVGRNMIVGFKHAIFLVSEKGKKRVGGGLGGKSDIGTQSIPRQAWGDDHPVSNDEIETVFTVFESDIPVQHEWAPESGRYKELWSRTIRATIPTESAAGGDKAGVQIAFYLPTQGTWRGEPVDYSTFALCFVKDGKCFSTSRLAVARSDDRRCFCGKVIIPSTLIDAAEFWLSGSRRNSTMGVSEKLKVGQVQADPVCQAARAGDVPKVEQLVRDNAALLDAVDGWGRTPLFWAAWNGNQALVERLVAQGANVNFVDNHGTTVLMAAVNSHKKAIVALLIDKGADVNPKTKWGDTPLLAAAGQQDVIDLLVSKGADIRAKDITGRTLLHRSAGQLSEQGVQSLIAKGLDPNGPSPHGWPLHLAAGAGNRGAVKALLAAGAKVDPHDEYGKTPLHWAAGNGQTGTAEMLLAAGANPNAGTLKEDRPFMPQGATPMHVAAERSRAEVISLLVSKGANVNAEAADRRPPLALTLHWRSSAEALKTARVLLEHGALPGDLLPQVEGIEMVRLFLAHRANVNAKSVRRGPLPMLPKPDGYTRLHIAAKRGETEIVKLLLDHRADVNAKDSRGQTPLAWALAAGQNDIATLLRASGGVK